jgi:hypothetical protein
VTTWARYRVGETPRCVQEIRKKRQKKNELVKLVLSKNSGFLRVNQIVSGVD